MDVQIILFVGDLRRKEEKSSDEYQNNTSSLKTLGDYNINHKTFFSLVKMKKNSNELSQLSD